jgi:hypothetical protein
MSTDEDFTLDDVRYLLEDLTKAREEYAAARAAYERAAREDDWDAVRELVKPAAAAANRASAIHDQLEPSNQQEGRTA